MDKWQFRTLMLQGKRVWVQGPYEMDDFTYLDYPNECGYIWSCRNGRDDVWVGQTWGDREPEQASFPMKRVHVHMDGYTLPLKDVYAFIDKLGGFDGPPETTEGEI